MKKIIAGILYGVSMLTTINAAALDMPKSSSYDTRIQSVNYNEQDVVEINAYPGVATQITFASDEEILDIASGFTAGWDFSPRRNQLYLKAKSIESKGASSNNNAHSETLEPEAGKWDTNLMVTTNLRVYSFQLILNKGRDDQKLDYNKKVAFRVSFKYPLEEAEKNKAASDKEATLAKLDQKPIPRNWNYSMQVGKQSDNIAPSMAYDNGRFTYLKFPNNREFPAAFIVSDDKSESLVNSHIDPKEPDVLVIHQVAKELVLRLGDAVVGVYDESNDQEGVAPTNGTTVPDVKRIVVDPKENKQGAAL